MDQHRGIVCELEPRDPLILELRQRRPERRLVVGDVTQRGVPVVDPVAEGRPAVVDRLRTNTRCAKPPLQRLGLSKRDERRELPDLHRRERRRDVAPDPLPQRCFGRRRAPHDDLRLGSEQGREEHQPLDVIQVQVGQQDVDRSLDPGQRQP